MAPTAGKTVLRSSGRRGVLGSGRAGVFNASGSCPECCGGGNDPPPGMRYRLSSCSGGMPPILSSSPLGPYNGSIIRVGCHCYGVALEAGQGEGPTNVVSSHGSCQSCKDSLPTECRCQESYVVSPNFVHPPPGPPGCWTQAFTNSLNVTRTVFRDVLASPSDPAGSGYRSWPPDGQFNAFARLLRQPQVGIPNPWWLLVGTIQFWVTVGPIPDSPLSLNSILPCPLPGTYPVYTAQGCPLMGGSATIG